MEILIKLDDNGIEIIRCSKCKEFKYKYDMVKDKKKKIGVRTLCKKCNSRNTIESQKNSETYKKLRRISYQKCIEKHNETRSKYNSTEEFKENRRQYFRKYYPERYKTDPEFKLRHRLAKRILTAIQREYKSGSTLELIGCSIDEAKKHIESQFKDGMTWDNHGLHGWHIDHIKPCASFDLTDPEQQKQCFHYTNLQPLWAEDNMKKGDKYKEI